MKNSAKEKNGLILFDMSRERLMDLACEKFESGESADALSLLHKCVRLFGVDEEILEIYADVYEGLELYSKAIDNWFVYLDEFGEESYEVDEEIYEGLAVDYMNLGFEMESLLYYKKMIDVAAKNPDRAEEERVANFEISDFFRSKSTPQLKLLNPSSKQDYATEINDAVRLMRTGDFSGAIERLATVDKSSPAYINAGNLLSVCYVLTGEVKKGLFVCREVLELYPEDIQTLATLAAMYAEIGEREKSRALAEELCARDVDETDVLYKIATVACENGLDDKAVEKFLRLEKRMPYDKNILYFLAVGEYRINDFSSSRKHFYKLLSFYPDACVAKMQMRKLLDFEDGKQSELQSVKPEMSYVYRVSDGEREEWIRFIKSLKKEDVEWLDEENDSPVPDAFNWCFDEFDGQDLDLQHFALHHAVRIGYDEWIKRQLLRHEVNDLVKFGVIYDLVLRNKPCSFGVVVANLYFKMRLPKIKLGQKMRSVFLHAAADLIAKYLAYDRKAPAMVGAATEEIYRVAVKEKGMEEIDEASLRCAIFLCSDLSRGKENISRTVREFGADLMKVAMLIPSMQALEEKNEVAVSDDELDEILKNFNEGEDL